MEWLFKYVYIVCMSFWVGGVSMFSFVQAPSLFKKLDSDKAGLCVSTMFPGYYKLGYICGFLAIVSFIYLEGLDYTRLSILVFMFVLSLVGGLYLLPVTRSTKIKLKNEHSNKLKKTFTRLHKLSMMLNFVVWICGMVMLYFISLG